MGSVSFDVVVVGAGPAGLMAARKAAEEQASVLLCEKDEALGLKPCGEAVSASTLKDAEVQPSPKFVANKVKGFTVYAPDESKRVEIWSEQLGFGEGYILEKPIFLRIFATVLSLTSMPADLNSAATLAVVLRVHFSPLMGSPAVSCFISSWMRRITSGALISMSS